MSERRYSRRKFIATAGLVGAFYRIQSINEQAPHLSKGVYSEIKLNGFNMPHLWGYDVARAGGGQRPMADLMANMLMIRGCDLGMDGHPINSGRLVSPVAGGTSITGLVADMTNSLFPAISVGETPANRAFKSPVGTSAVEIPSEHDDYLSFLLEIFYRQNDPTYRSRQSLDAQVEKAMGALRAYSLSNNPGAEILYNERQKSERLLRKGIENLGQAFSPLVKKYEDLFQRSLHLSPVAGVTDGILPGLKFPCEVPGHAGPAKALASHHLDGRFLCPPDIRTLYRNAKSQNLAKHFALAEFALTEGLSSSILLSSAHERGFTLMGLDSMETYRIEQLESSFDPERGVTIFHVKDGAKSELHTQDMLHDSHGTGWLSNVVTCTLFYRGFSSCLIELIDRLKEQRLGGGTLFDETVIHFATEFDRIPVNRGAFSDHNFKAHVTSLYSGIIQEPMILGNVYVGRRKAEDELRPSGTLGDAAPIPSLDNQMISTANVSSTLSEMLRIPRVVPRAPALVTVNGNRLRPAIEAGRNVEDNV
ncbi:MAG: hypothetical protein HY074_07060 [Deltaproteobacteria bacterium]|nr:hypothetical protein [Deltaproteobacteria bacterium]